MPDRLETFWGNLNKSNMKRRLYDIYKWNVGRREANKTDFADWLGDLGDWFETHVQE
jgi:hypothetical protein